MKTAVLVSMLALLALATPAAAQFQTVKSPPKTWVSGWGSVFMDPGRVADQSGIWDFGSAFGGGLGLHRQVGTGLALGIEGSFSPVSYEMRDPQGMLIGDGKARLATTMLTGRLQTSGGAGLGMYMTGGAGAFIYGMPDLDRWDPDFALYTGAGLEYRAATRQALFVEWGRYWTFHQKEGIRDNTVKHSQIRAGVRLGL